MSTLAEVTERQVELHFDDCLDILANEAPFGASG